MANARILVVEDEASLLKGYVEFFEGQGYEVCAADTLESAAYA